MARPLSFLILAIAVACAALFLLLPMSKLAQQRGGDEPAPAAAAPATETRSNVEVVASAQAIEPGSAVEANALEQGQQPAQEPATRVAVTGQVSDNFGAAIAGLEIDLHRIGQNGEAIGPTRVISDRHGNFTLQLLQARQYRLEIMATAEYAGYSLDPFTDASAEKLQGIELARVEPVDVDGMVVDTDFAPVGEFELILKHLTLEIPDRVIRSDSSGYFSLRDIPAGAWRVTTDQSDYFRIEGLELRPGEYRNLQLMIDRGSYHLSGWVADVNGMPLERVVVTLKSNFATDLYQSFAYRSVATDRNGAFEFARLGGHRMTLGIYASGFETYIREHEFTSFSDALEIELSPE